MALGFGAILRASVVVALTPSQDEYREPETIHSRLRVLVASLTRRKLTLLEQPDPADARVEQEATKESAQEPRAKVEQGEAPSKHESRRTEQSGAAEVGQGQDISTQYEPQDEEPSAHQDVAEPRHENEMQARQEVSDKDDSSEHPKFGEAQEAPCDSTGDEAQEDVTCPQHDVPEWEGDDARQEPAHESRRAEQSSLVEAPRQQGLDTQPEAREAVAEQCPHEAQEEQVVAVEYPQHDIAEHEHAVDDVRPETANEGEALQLQDERPEQAPDVKQGEGPLQAEDAVACDDAREDPADFASKLRHAVAAALRAEADAAAARGSYAEAEGLLRRCLDSAGPSASWLEKLGDALRLQGKHDESAQTYAAAIALLDEGDAKIAMCLAKRGRALAAQQRFDEARDSYNEACAQYAANGNERRLAAVLANLASLYYCQGLYADAEPLYAQCLSIRERVLGPAHPRVATSLNNLAAVTDLLGQTQRAYDLYRKSLALCDQLLPPDDPTRIQVLDNIKLALHKLGGATLDDAPRSFLDEGDDDDTHRAVTGARPSTTGASLRPRPKTKFECRPPTSCGTTRQPRRPQGRRRLR